MRKTKALFIRRETALKAAIKAALDVGASPQTILELATAAPVYRRGELLGYHATYPDKNKRQAVIVE